MLSKMRDELIEVLKTTGGKKGTTLAESADLRKVRENRELKHTRGRPQTCMGGRESSMKDKRESNDRSRLEGSEVHI